MTKRTSNRFSPEVRQRAVRMVLEHGGDHASHMIRHRIVPPAYNPQPWA